MRDRSAIAFGEVLYDLLSSPNSVTQALGGAPANFANRLGALGTKTFLVSRIGQDPLGSALFSELSDHGNINLAFLQKDGLYDTGTVQVNLDESGRVKDYEIKAAVAYDFIEASDPKLLEQVRQCSAFYFGSLAQRAPASQTALAQLLNEVPKDAIRFFDINLRKTALTTEQLRNDVILPSIAQAHVLKLNSDEVCELEKFSLVSDASSEIRAVEDLFSQFPHLKSIIITKAGQGSSVYGHEYRELFKIDLPAMRLVRAPNADDVGCGDAFSAGILHKLISYGPNGLTLERLCDAAEYASVVAGMTYAKRGGMPEITKAEMDEGLQVYGHSAVVTKNIGKLLVLPARNIQL